MSGRPSLRILHLEDNVHDCELVAAALRHGGLSCTVTAVSTRAEFEAALQADRYDAILADDRLPAFDGLTAQRIAAERAPESPFIVVSGTLGEDVAVERVKNGAVDYVLKQHLTRLPGSITRAIGEARIRVEHARAEVEVRRLNAELEQRVLERTTQLASANRALAAGKQALHESEARLNAILDNSPAIITMKDADGRYVVINRQFEQRFRMTRDHAVGRTDRELFAPRLAETYRANDVAVLNQRIAMTFEERALHGDDVCIYSSSKFPLIGADGTACATGAISSDITDQKHADDEIKMARLEAERANRAKSEFLSRMSHDLRTPLNAVLGFAQLLASENLPDEQVECVRQILKGGEHLLELVNEVLDIARIEAGRLSLSPEPVGVNEIVRHAVALVGPLTRQLHVAITVEESPLAALSVVADRLRLNQILLNLLSNAVKYNSEAGTVTVGFALAPDGALRITVTDTGSGIPPKKLRLLFRPFERLGAESTGIEGTGLGLTLSRGLAEAMGGSLGVSSHLGIGSTFWVELQVANQSERAEVKPESAPIEYQAGRPATVLYIEDNISNVRLMERVLARRPSVTLATAADGQEGVLQALARRPDLVLLDLHLPDLPGEEVLRRLRSEPALSDMAVIVLSADGTPGQIRRLLASGASAYLTKPFAIHEVLAVVDRMLAGRRRAEFQAQEHEPGV